MPNPKLCMTWILPLLGVAGLAHAQAPFCGLDFVSQRAMGVELHFAPDSNVFVRVGKAGQDSPTDQVFRQVEGQMHRVYPGAPHPERDVSEVFLFPSDQAFVGGDVHSSCMILPDYQGGTT